MKAILRILPCALATTPVVAQTLSEQSFRTPEYWAQPGLEVIHAAALYARGGTGRGVTVAMIDSGITPTHPEFSQRLAAPGYSYIDEQARVRDDPVGHGTNMAGLIAANKDQRGMHGVAFQAKLLPLQFGVRCAGPCAQPSEPFTFDTQIARAWQYAMAQGAQIFSNAWSNDLDPHILTGSHYRALMPASLAAAKDLVRQGALFVFPTGNEVRRQPQMEAGLPYLVPALEAGWLAVTAVKNDGSGITDKANACGIARAWCLAAPGGDAGAGKGLLTTDRHGGYAETTATSAAAAVVAGALAALQSHLPNLTPQQLRQRLLRSAKKTGVYADQALYGQGLLDLKAALALPNTD